MKKIQIKLASEQAETIHRLAAVNGMTDGVFTVFALKHGLTAFLDQVVEDAIRDNTEFEISEMFEEGITAGVENEN